MLLAVVLLAPSARAEVRVRVASGQVDIDASAAPLADVLDRLARQTGMEIVYEGTPPRQRITLALAGRSATEAVLAILEGQGLNYALVSDPTGTRVQTLIIAGPAGKGTSAGSSSGRGRPGQRTRPRRPTPPPAANPEMMDPGFDDIEMEEEEPFDFDDPSMLVGPEMMGPEDAADSGGDEALPGVETEAPIPAAGPMPFPGNRQIFSTSPFTPQPQSPQPVAPGPPDAGPGDGSDAAGPPPE